MVFRCRFGMQWLVRKWINGMDWQHSSNRTLRRIVRHFNFSLFCLTLTVSSVQIRVSNFAKLFLFKLDWGIYSYPKRTFQLAKDSKNTRSIQVKMKPWLFLEVNNKQWKIVISIFQDTHNRLISTDIVICVT